LHYSSNDISPFFYSIFTKAPLSYKLLFPFGTTSGPAMFESEDFIEAARTASTLMDMSVSLLECEMDALFGQLLEIGLEHANFPRIQTSHWSMMRDALLRTLASYSSALSEDCKDLEKVLSAWSLVFDNLSNEMVETIKPMKRKSWDSVSTTQGESVSQDSSASSAGWSQNR
jgi:hypothetical protein